MSGANIAREVRRNLQTHIRAAFADFTGKRISILHLADNAESLRVYEAIDELATLDRAIFVQNDHGHVFHIGVERITEGDHLDQRREKHEEQRHRVAPDDDEFLKENCAETAERFVFHVLNVACIGHPERSEGPRSLVAEDCGICSSSYKLEISLLLCEVLRFAQDDRAAVCHPERSEGPRISSYSIAERSVHFGFNVSINAFFLLRRQPLISFSRLIASRGSSKLS
jgi:hypothetical protein